MANAVTPPPKPKTIRSRAIEAVMALSDPLTDRCESAKEYRDLPAGNMGECCQWHREFVRIAAMADLAEHGRVLASQVAEMEKSKRNGPRLVVAPASAYPVRPDELQRIDKRTTRS